MARTKEEEEEEEEEEERNVAIRYTNTSTGIADRFMGLGNSGTCVDYVLRYPDAEQVPLRFRALIDRP